ncbi:MAG: hypothetical protein EB084_23775 [Proteobacteria bacterium]|nr:hypothetical protein [Pseudomonadota bacterium]
MRRYDVQMRRRKEQAELEAWPGSSALEGLNTRYRLVGFVAAEIVASSGSMRSKGQFITGSIVTGPNAPKVAGGLGFTIDHSRLVAETRTSLGGAQLHLLGAFDAFKEADVLSPHYRTRSLFAEVTDLAFGGDLLVGQYWSSVSNLEAFPNVLDPSGPNSFYGCRRSMIRWSQPLVDGVYLRFSGEQPEKHVIQNAVSRQGRPDLVAALAWERDPLWLQCSVNTRELVGTSGQTQCATSGWGVSLSGRLEIPVGRHTDLLSAGATWGRGIGSYFNDSAPPDAIFVSSASGSRIDAIPVTGWFVSMQHQWSPSFHSVVSQGIVSASNLSVQPGSSFRRTTYTTANLVWQPSARWMLGVEGQWGYRRNLDGAAGSASRVQVTTRYDF